MEAIGETISQNPGVREAATTMDVPETFLVTQTGYKRSGE
jgi:hypothetical protein